MTTKFSIGQEVWFMDDNEPTCMQISGIGISSKPTKYDITPGSDKYGNVLEWGEPTIRYEFWDVDGTYSKRMFEEYVFATKEELRKDVFGE